MSDETRHSRGTLSEHVDLKRLERESYRWLCLGTFLGVVFHAVLGVLITADNTQVEQQKRIPIELIITQPRPETPFEIRDHPLTRIYRYRSRHRKRQPSKNLPVRPLSSMQEKEPMPQSPYQHSDDGIYDSTNESVEAFDNSQWIQDSYVPFRQGLMEENGEFTARVIVDPRNKKAIEGYAALAYVWPHRTDPVEGMHTPVIDLAENLNRFTNILARPVIKKVSGTSGGNPHFVSIEELLRDSQPSSEKDQHYPFVYFSAENLKKHPQPSKALSSAGFFMIDNGCVDDGLTVSTEEIIDILIRTYGYELIIRPLEKTHPIYHCFFDFENGPPTGVVSTEERVLTGYFLDRRLLGVYCHQGYGELWGDTSKTLQGRLGVNLAVYALAPGLWVDENTRISFQDIATGDLSMWHDNGKARFKASERGRVDASRKWVPDSRRIYSYIINYNSPGTPFDPDLVITYNLFNIDEFGKRLPQGKYNIRETWHYNGGGGKADYYGEIGDTLPWGLYNVHEAWHSNGGKAYYYNHNVQTFSEWDERGDVMASRSPN